MAFEMTCHESTRLAVLIDADNAQSIMVGHLLAEIAKYGTAFVKRAYGDWTGTNLKGWKEQLLKQSIQPIQQFAYTHGKNATDAAMIVDAMDLLYSNRLDGFCLVSSDSDFTRLASRIRESGLIVYGFGERKTPKPFVVACDKFIYVENLTHDDHAPNTDNAHHHPDLEKQLKLDNRLVKLLQGTTETASEDDGWAALANVGNLLIQRHPDFDSRTYGYAKLSGLFAAASLFDITHRVPAEGKPAVIYVRNRKQDS